MCLDRQTFGFTSHVGFAEYLIVLYVRYLVDPDDLDPIVACTFPRYGVTSLNAVRKAMPMSSEQPVVMLGAGGLGLASISALHAVGHKKIISVDISAEKLGAAKEAGASSVVTASELQSEKIAGIKAAAGDGARLNVIDFFNNEATASVAQEILVKGGRWVQVGAMGSQVGLNLLMIVLKAITIMGMLSATLPDPRDLVQPAQKGQSAPLLVQTMSWNDADTAVNRVRDGKVTGQLVLVRP